MPDAPTTTVANVPEDLTLVDDSREVRHILDSIGYDDKGLFGCLFVGVEDGDYTDIYAIRGSVPWLHRTAYLIHEGGR